MSRVGPPVQRHYPILRHKSVENGCQRTMHRQNVAVSVNTDIEKGVTELRCTRHQSKRPKSWSCGCGGEIVDFAPCCWSPRLNCDAINFCIASEVIRTIPF